MATLGVRKGRGGWALETLAEKRSVTRPVVALNPSEVSVTCLGKEVWVMDGQGGVLGR